MAILSRADNEAVAFLSDPWLLWVFSLIAIPVVIIGVFWLASALAYHEGDNVYVDGKVRDASGSSPEVRQAVARAEGLTVLGYIGAVLASILAVVMLTGSATTQHRALLAEDPTAFTKYYFLDMSEADSDALVREGKTVEVGVYSFDGREHNVEVRFDTSPLTYRLVLANPEDYDLFNGFPVHISDQLDWMVTGLAEHEYGITLEEGQVEDLLVPKELPTAPNQYGTTPVVLSLGDGEFQRIDATLIWDGDEFQLVGAMDGDTLTELPEK